MKKKGSSHVPDFSSRRGTSASSPPPTKGTSRVTPPRTQVVKPQATSSKSGRRGQ